MKQKPGPRWSLLLAVATMMAVTATTSPAQESRAIPAAGAAAEVAAPAAVSQAVNWRQLLEQGGFLMYVLGAMSFATVAFIIYFFVVLRPGQVASPALLRELVDKIRAGAQDDARRAAEYRPGPLSSVVLSAMNYIRDVAEPDPSLLRDVMEGEGVRQADAIQGQTQYLLDIAAVAPMVGLLGTVFGMYKAFGSVANDIASAKPVVLAAGVSQALITTAFGLIVGIPAMAFYAYFRRRSSKLVSYLESSSTEVLTALLSRK